MSDISSSGIRPRVNAKEAIKAAKTQVAELLEGEKYSDLGLEEVRYEDRSGQWVITLGWNRPWNVERQQQSGLGILYSSPSSSTTRQIRSFKKVRIDGQTGELISLEGTD